MTTTKAVMGLAATVFQAEAIVAELHRAGFANRDISVLLPDGKESRDLALEPHTKAPQGAIAGASAGGVVGGALGLLVGLGLLTIPGVGPFLAAGPIMTALSGAAVGAAAGGVSGGLMGFGVPEIEAKQYAGKLKSGNILLSVHVAGPDGRTRARKILEDAGATHVVTVDEQSVPVTPAATF